ncbi:hypothetical protein P7K49_000185 [Saguinus oedipus]|uniref:60S ribosomal protein L35 n=1 Tax=Saguinus oedipus TaxID=9490 RepID=A0ABQ9WAZ1_SAGOE|nr:hypothetical protein P7K49_000185 [Saguinus oedipus]
MPSTVLAFEVRSRLSLPLHKPEPPLWCLLMAADSQASLHRCHLKYLLFPKLLKVLGCETQGFSEKLKRLHPRTPAVYPPSFYIQNIDTVPSNLLFADHLRVSTAMLRAMTKMKSGDLLRKKEEELLKQLGNLKVELSQLRVVKVTGSTASELSKI